MAPLIKPGENRCENCNRPIVSLGDPTCNCGIQKEHHWVVGGGMVGCLYDFGPIALETLDAALDCLCDLYELDTAQRNQLRWTKHLSLGADYGADYCEITCHNGPCPDSED